MARSSTLYIGIDVHKESIAVASVAHDHGAEGVSLGTIGTWQVDSDKLLQQLWSKSTQLVFVYVGCRLAGKPGRGTLEKERPPVFGMMQRGGKW